jgi:hypothetical protein
MIPLKIADDGSIATPSSPCPIINPHGAPSSIAPTAAVRRADAQNPRHPGHQLYGVLPPAHFRCRPSARATATTICAEVIVLSGLVNLVGEFLLLATTTNQVSLAADHRNRRSDAGLITPLRQH